MKTVEDGMRYFHFDVLFAGNFVSPVILLENPNFLSFFSRGISTISPKGERILPLLKKKEKER